MPGDGGASGKSGILAWVLTGGYAVENRGMGWPMQEPAGDGKLVWIDLEMTGLDADVDVILEIATLVTDSALRIVAEGPELAIHHDAAVLARMDDWNVRHHTASGLLERVRHSEVSVVEAEAVTLAFVAEHVPAKVSPLCGNTVWQDRRFLMRYMPTLNDHLHYRIIDVSTIKELARRWRPESVAGVRKAGSHRAMADIRESLRELKHYRESFFHVY